MSRVAEELEVRRVEFANDVADILVIENASYDEDSRWQAIDFKAALRDGADMLVCLVDDLVVGFCLYKVDQTHANILSIAVHPMYRRQHFGSLLIDAVRYKGCGRVRCVVHETSLDMHRFLRSLGIKARRVLRRHYGEFDGFEFVE